VGGYLLTHRMTSLWRHVGFSQVGTSVLVPAQRLLLPCITQWNKPIYPAIYKNLSRFRVYGGGPHYKTCPQNYLLACWHTQTHTGRQTRWKQYQISLSWLITRLTKTTAKLIAKTKWYRPISKLAKLLLVQREWHQKWRVAERLLQHSEQESNFAQICRWLCGNFVYTLCLKKVYH